MARAKVEEGKKFIRKDISMDPEHDGRRAGNPYDVSK